MKVEELKGEPFSGLVDVAQLLREPVGSSRSYGTDEIIDEQARGSVQGKVTLMHTRRGILVQGKLNVEVEIVCSRCLNVFLYPVAFNIEEEFLCTSNSLPSSEEQGDVTISSDNVLDLGEIIRQNTLLNLPMKPLCRPDCAGIKEISSYGFT
jgi:uncharacterized metal-binding protein YceD (DUF177 family)